METLHGLVHGCLAEQPSGIVGLTDELWETESLHLKASAIQAEAWSLQDRQREALAIADSVKSTISTLRLGGVLDEVMTRSECVDIECTLLHEPFDERGNVFTGHVVHLGQSGGNGVGAVADDPEDGPHHVGAVVKGLLSCAVAHGSHSEWGRWGRLPHGGPDGRTGGGDQFLLQVDTDPRANVMVPDPHHDHEDDHDHDHDHDH